MDLPEDLRILLLNLGFIMTYKTHKTLILIKNHLNYLQDDIFKCFFKKYNKLLFFLIFFSQHIMMENQRSEKEKIIKDITNFLD